MRRPCEPAYGSRRRRCISPVKSRHVRGRGMPACFAAGTPLHSPRPRLQAVRSQGSSNSRCSRFQIDDPDGPAYSFAANGPNFLQEHVHMATTEERLRKIVDDNLEVEGRTPGTPLNESRNFADAGVPSPDIVAFWKLVNEEFGVDISAEQFAELLTPSDLIAHLDAG
ncbi:MAG: acyl carrier protein [Dehalococcoidia bacterium]|nr:acyl carrier protein [Dehalococcoidia bacterium]MYI86613.1 acyl carrier protein [Dehalococcoidia bacterium]